MSFWLALFAFSVAVVISAPFYVLHTYYKSRQQRRENRRKIHPLYPDTSFDGGKTAKRIGSEVL